MSRSLLSRTLLRDGSVIASFTGHFSTAVSVSAHTHISGKQQTVHAYGPSTEIVVVLPHCIKVYQFTDAGNQVNPILDMNLGHTIDRACILRRMRYGHQKVPADLLMLVTVTEDIIVMGFYGTAASLQAAEVLSFNLPIILCREAKLKLPIPKKLSPSLTSTTLPRKDTNLVCFTYKSASTFLSQVVFLYFFTEDGDICCNVGLPRKNPVFNMTEDINYLDFMPPPLWFERTGNLMLPLLITCLQTHIITMEILRSDFFFHGSSSSSSKGLKSTRLPNDPSTSIDDSHVSLQEELLTRVNLDADRKEVSSSNEILYCGGRVRYKTNGVKLSEGPYTIGPFNHEPHALPVVIYSEPFETLLRNHSSLTTDETSALANKFSASRGNISSMLIGDQDAGGKNRADVPLFPLLIICADIVTVVFNYNTSVTKPIGSLDPEHFPHMHPQCKPFALCQIHPTNNFLCTFDDGTVLFLSLDFTQASQNLNDIISIRYLDWPVVHTGNKYISDTRDKQLLDHTKINPANYQREDIFRMPSTLSISAFQYNAEMSIVLLGSQTVDSAVLKLITAAQASESRASLLPQLELLHPRLIRGHGSVQDICYLGRCAIMSIAAHGRDGSFINSLYGYKVDCFFDTEVEDLCGSSILNITDLVIKGANYIFLSLGDGRLLRFRLQVDAASGYRSGNSFAEKTQTFGLRQLSAADARDIVLANRRDDILVRLFALPDGNILQVYRHCVAIGETVAMKLDGLATASVCCGACMVVATTADALMALTYDEGTKTLRTIYNQKPRKPISYLYDYMLLDEDEGPPTYIIMTGCMDEGFSVLSYRPGDVSLTELASYRVDRIPKSFLLLSKESILEKQFHDSLETGTRPSTDDENTLSSSRNKYVLLIGYSGGIIDFFDVEIRVDARQGRPAFIVQMPADTGAYSRPDSVCAVPLSLIQPVARTDFLAQFFEAREYLGLVLFATGNPSYVIIKSFSIFLMRININLNVCSLPSKVLRVARHHEYDIRFAQMTPCPNKTFLFWVPSTNTQLPRYYLNLRYKRWNEKLGMDQDPQSDLDCITKNASPEAAAHTCNIDICTPIPRTSMIKTIVPPHARHTTQLNEQFLPCAFICVANERVDTFFSTRGACGFWENHLPDNDAWTLDKYSRRYLSLTIPTLHHITSMKRCILRRTPIIMRADVIEERLGHVAILTEYYLGQSQIRLLKSSNGVISNKIVLPSAVVCTDMQIFSLGESIILVAALFNGVDIAQISLKPEQRPPASSDDADDDEIPAYPRLAFWEIGHGVHYRLLGVYPLPNVCVSIAVEREDGRPAVAKFEELVDGFASVLTTNTDTSIDSSSYIRPIDLNITAAVSLILAIGGSILKLSITKSLSNSSLMRSAPLIKPTVIPAAAGGVSAVAAPGYSERSVLQKMGSNVSIDHTVSSSSSQKDVSVEQFYKELSVPAEEQGKHHISNAEQAVCKAYKNSAASITTKDESDAEVSINELDEAIKTMYNICEISDCGYTFTSSALLELFVAVDAEADAPFTDRVDSIMSVQNHLYRDLVSFTKDSLYSTDVHPQNEKDAIDKPEGDLTDILPYITPRNYIVLTSGCMALYSSNLQLIFSDTSAIFSEIKFALPLPRSFRCTRKTNEAALQDFYFAIDNENIAAIIRLDHTERIRSIVGNLENDVPSASSVDLTTPMVSFHNTSTAKSDMKCKADDAEQQATAKIVGILSLKYNITSARGCDQFILLGSDTGAMLMITEVQSGLFTSLSDSITRFTASEGMVGVSHQIDFEKFCSENPSITDYGCRIRCLEMDTIHSYLSCDLNMQENIARSINYTRGSVLEAIVAVNFIN